MAGRGLWGWSPMRSCRAPDSVNTSASPCSRLNFRNVKGQGSKVRWSLNTSHKPALWQSSCTCDIHEEHTTTLWESHYTLFQRKKLSKAREVTGSKKHAAGASLEHFPSPVRTPHSPSGFTGHCIIPQAKLISTANGGGDFMRGPHYRVQLVLEVTRDARKEKEGSPETVPREMGKEFLSAPSHSVPIRAALWARDQAHRAR